MIPYARGRARRSGGGRGTSGADERPRRWATHHRHRRRQGRRRQEPARRQPRHLPRAARQARRAPRRRSRRRQPAHLRRRRAARRSRSATSSTSASRASRTASSRPRSRTSAWSPARAIRCGRPTRSPATKNRLINQVRDLDVDYLICDLPPGSGFNALDFFLVAHVGVLVVVPEPTSVENTFRFIKSAFLRRLRGMPGARASCRSTAPTRAASRRRSTSTTPRSRTATRELAARVLEEIHRFRPRLVVNQTRTRADLDLGAAAALGGPAAARARRRLPRPPRVRRRGVARGAQAPPARRRAPRGQGDEEPRAHRAPAARDRAGEARRRSSRRARTEEQTLYEVLEIDPGASDEEIRRAYKRVREMYAAESMVVCGLFAPERLEVVHERIEEAYDMLLDPRAAQALRPRAVPRGHPDAARRRRRPRDRRRGDAAAPTRRRRRAELRAPSRRSTADTEFTGELLSACARRAASTSPTSRSAPRSASRTCARSRTSAGSSMPAAVYLRGFLVEYARFMKLDVQHVTRSYLARYTKGKAATG